MRSAALAALLLLPFPSAGSPFPGHRALSVEAGLSGPLRGGAPAAPALAVTASFWLEGPVEATAAVSFADLGARGGRPSGEAGLRATAGGRWNAFAEAVAGWAEGGRGRVGVTAGAGAGIGLRAGAWALGLRAGLRAGGDGPRLLVLAGAGGYF
jgi:hypothetical protein